MGWLVHDVLLLPTLVLYCALVLVGVWFNNQNSLKIILAVEAIFVVLFLIEYSVYLLLSLIGLKHRNDYLKRIFTYNTFALFLSLSFWIIEFATITKWEHTFQLPGFLRGGWLCVQFYRVFFLCIFMCNWSKRQKIGGF